MSVETKVEKITPEKAQKMLERNYDRQRPLSATSVSRYAQAMVDGTFNVNHPPIALTSKGEVLDGQHRLAAIVKSGKTLSLSVSRGVPEESFAYIDIGRGRNFADRSGISRSEIEPASALVRMALGASALSDRYEAAVLVHSLLVMEIAAVCQAKGKAGVTATMRGVVAVLMKMFPESLLVIKEQLRAFREDDYTAMSARVAALHKKMYIGRGGPGAINSTDREDVFAYSIAAFHPHADPKSKVLRTSDAYTQAVVNFIRTLVGTPKRPARKEPVK